MREREGMCVYMGASLAQLRFHGFHETCRTAITPTGFINILRRKILLLKTSYNFAGVITPAGFSSKLQEGKSSQHFHTRTIPKVLYRSTKIFQNHPKS